MSLKGKGTSASKPKKQTQPKKPSVPKKQEIKIPVLPDKLFENSPIMTKFIKVNMNGTEKLVQIPCPNISYIKKQNSLLPHSSGRISDKVTVRASSPVRISETESIENENSIPCSLSYFDFPENEKNQERIDAKIKLKELYDMVKNLNLNNSGTETAKIYKLAYEEIFAKYTAYPDICMIARQYLTDVTFKLNPNYWTSGSYVCKMYDQLKDNYDFYNSDKYPNISKEINLIENRKLLIKNNDDNIKKQISEYINSINSLRQELKNVENRIYTDMSQDSINYFVDCIAYAHDNILNMYQNLYRSYISIGDYKSAHFIFDCNIINGKLQLSGTFFKEYDKIPIKSIFKYQIYNPAEKKYSAQQEKEVDQTKHAEELLKMMNTYISDEASNIDKQEFDGNVNLFQYKISKCCDFIKDFEPSNGEIIDSKKLKDLKKNACGYGTIPGYENYYKNNPAIAKLYFSKLENTEITSENILVPTAQMRINAALGSAASPQYSFKTKIVSEISNRTLEVILKRDYLSGGFYALFQPNTESKKLINDDPKYKKKSVAVSFGVKTFSFMNVTNLYCNKNLFDKQMGYSTPDGESDSAEVKCFKNSQSFLESGGAEVISTKLAKNNTENDYITAEVYIKNQASFFVISAHSNELTGDLSTSNAVINPMFLYDENKVSKYKDIKTLIITGCGALIHDSIPDLNYTPAGTWHTLMPKALILGYSKTIFAPILSQSFTVLNEKLTAKPNMTPTKIANLWCEINFDIAFKYISSQAEYFTSGMSYVAIYGNTLYYRGRFVRDSDTEKIYFKPDKKFFNEKVGE